MQTAQAAPPADPLRGLKLMTVLNIILLSVQGWTGDVANLFAVFPSGAVSGLDQFFQSLSASGPGPITEWHGLEGIVILLISGGIAVASFRRSNSRGVRAVALLGLFFVLAAALGGYLFVLSGFTADGNSAQMAGSFIGAYAMYFLVLYYSKP